ncbi:Uncharacterized protein OBRU01_09574 [Operophtera brumata]|uniref:DUF7041 domain-containing protein n=1 Tax=Operophtera brumata TaxID=104452 RepID=A0A0L7LG32_OPEBR|nr:Uncharacterized protein OBRU01_09574 [Operophtera brumata]
MEPQKQGDSTKYNLVIAKLNRDALQQVGDLILNPPEDNKFETIKERLLAVYEESAEKQFHNLVSGMDLGTQRPSQLLRKMSGLATNTQIPTEALRRLWISRLPTAVRTILTVTPEAKLDDLAKIADKIIENMNIGEVCAMGNATVPDMTDQLARMTMELKSLREEINESKEEKVIITQEGANNVRQVGDLEKKIETYGIMRIVITVVITFLCLCICGRKCFNLAKRWARKEMAALDSVEVADKAVTRSTQHNDTCCKNLG